MSFTTGARSRRPSLFTLIVLTSLGALATNLFLPSLDNMARDFGVPYGVMQVSISGYLAGSGWRAYQASGALCGIILPAGLRLAEKLPEPIFTPSSKAAPGAHDENIDFQQVVEMVGLELAEKLRETTLAVYRFAAAYAARRGIVIADTKLEFGLDENGVLHLMDEVLTPDSSRFWPASEYQVGSSPPSYDKQFVRDYLETLDWDKAAPGPELPVPVIAGTVERYAEALHTLTGLSPADHI